MAITVKQCKDLDVDLLGEYLYSTSPCVHKERFLEQRLGNASYLIAWEHDVPVGHLKINWKGSSHNDVRSRLGVHPELGRLYVATSMRKKGIGTALLLKAEEIILGEGISVVGLAVGITNHSAVRLYVGLGYGNWGYGTFVSDQGLIIDDGVRETEHTVTYMVKRLQRYQRGISNQSILHLDAEPIPIVDGISVS